MAGKCEFIIDHFHGGHRCEKPSTTTRPDSTGDAREVCAKHAAMVPLMPDYKRVAQVVRDQIMTGELRGGDRLPSNREMAGQFGVCRDTVTRALRLLKREGLVVAGKGWEGSFVAYFRPKREVGGLSDS